MGSAETTKSELPRIPEALGNLFLFVSPTSWYIRWNGAGAHIGTTDRRKASALDGLKLIRELLGSQGRTRTTAQLHGYDQPTYVDGESIGTSAYQDYGVEGVFDGEVKEDNRRAWDRGSSGPGVHIASFVPAKAYETRDLLRSFALAVKLIRDKLPLFADHLSQRISTPLGTNNPLQMRRKDPTCHTRQSASAKAYDREWRYTDDETQWIFGSVWDFDGSNLFVYDSPGNEGQWRLRLGEHDCQVPDSDGMWILGELLRNTRKGLTSEEVCNEAGVCLPRTPKAFIAEPEIKLIDFVERANEFGLGSSQTTGDEFLDRVPLAHGLEEATDELIDDLQSAADSLKKRALESHAAQTLRTKGIAHKAAGADKDFATTVAKLKRCEKLVTELQNWRIKHTPRTLSKVTPEEELNNALARRDWIVRATHEAICEIEKKSAYLGTYFRRSFRTDNDRFVLDLDDHWIVD